MPEDKPKPTIDERLAAVIQSLELMLAQVEITRDYYDRLDQQVARLDARERKAREALLAGIMAYLQALKEDKS